MDKETAQRLFMEGAIFLFLDVPEGTEFGIDMKSWNVGERFRGVKMIPPGVHYIFYSSVGTMGETSPRTGFFHHFHKGELVVRKWDKENEQMSNEPIDESIISNFHKNILNMEKFLGPYPYDIHEKWTSLTSHVTDDIWNTLSPVCGIVSSALDLIPTADEKRKQTLGTFDEPSGSKSEVKRRPSSDNEKKEDALLPDLVPVQGTELRFTKIPDKRYPDGSTGMQITQHCMDSSYTLELLIKEYKRPLDLIGEIEFSYVCFLVGHSLEAFENWKKLVSLLCSCDRAIEKFRSLYDALINVLEVQICEIPQEFLADIVSNNNFIYMKLRSLFRAISESNVDGRLKTKSERFKEQLMQSFLWDFSHLSSEDEEDAPVIVEM